MAAIHFFIIGDAKKKKPKIYSVFDLNVQVESTTGATGITGKSKTKHPRVHRGLLFLNTQLKNALGQEKETRTASHPDMAIVGYFLRR